MKKPDHLDDDADVLARAGLTALRAADRAAAALQVSLAAQDKLRAVMREARKAGIELTVANNSLRDAIKDLNVYAHHSTAELLKRIKK